ncbi:nitrate reductase NapE component [Streptomyces sp. V3I8]|jgi:hypothetical protein|uniref:DUF7144 family membrane protein n=1 Tax=Streptomyces sp. V3I8 TaxID=3042279 RepID=UPI0027871257|nr:hypothetical protein [Streptomyces sp. V3I8]MDQ1034210.1 nitrate reductase NapE component [Streptomyces sp. V3I8]
MTATHTGQARAHSAGRHWAEGLTVFAAIMLMIAGVLDILRGVMAVAEDDIFVNTPNYVFEFDLTSWGWIHLALGTVAVIVSVGLFQASTWARVAGIAIGGLIIIGNFLSMPYYPVWSIIMIAASGFIIWALSVVRQEDFDESFTTPPRGR